VFAVSAALEHLVEAGARTTVLVFGARPTMRTITDELTNALCGRVPPRRRVRFRSSRAEVSHIPPILTT
jgi:ATP-dependent Clp protease ATP-binding subunit ClpA